MAEFLSVSELKEFLRVSSMDRDTQIEEIRDATIAHVAGRVVVALGADYADVTARPRAGTLFLPVIGATELVSLTAPDGTDVPLDSLPEIDVDAGLIELPSLTWSGTYRARLRFPDAQADVLLACKHIAKHLWSITQRGAQGGARGDVDPQGEVLSGFAIPRRAEQLLAPYERTGGFA